MSWLSRRAFGLTMLCAMLCACTSPTLPLPPPAEPSILASVTPGLVTLTSTTGAQPNAIIVVFNTNPAVSRDDRVSATQADERGSWKVDVVASSGDRLDITQEIDTDRSPSTSITVPKL